MISSSKFYNFKMFSFHNIYFSVLFYLISFLSINNNIDLSVFTLILSTTCILNYIVFDENKFKIFLFSLKSFYVSLICFISIFSLYEIIFKNNIYIHFQNYKFSLLLPIVTSIILFLFFEFLINKNLNSDKIDYILSDVNVLIPVSAFVLLIGKNESLLYILLYSKHSNLISFLFLASSLLDIYFGIFTVFSISKSYNLSVFKYQNEILNMQYELQTNNLNQLEKYQKDIRRISHDIKNHKIILYNLIKNNDNEKALTYLQSFGTGFDDSSYEILTNHKILNALFLKKKEICKNNNINFNLEIDIPQTISISDFDICIIVGNLIDNAIEACNKLENNAYINVKSKIANNNFIFEIKNNFDGLINYDKNKILTSKNDILNHGLGISNIKTTIEKYFGTYDFSNDNNEFVVFIMIPLP